VPSAYLRWCLAECQCLHDWLRREIQAELKSRFDSPRRGQSGRPALPDLSSIVARWHHEMALRFHPDRGGTVEAMQAVNHAADRLKELLGV
jgi:hypothetical protein